MTQKTTLSFTDKHYDFIAAKVKDGAFASASSVVASALEQMMQDEAEREIALEAMKAVIKERMTLSKDQWIPHDEAIFEEINNKLQAASDS